MKRDFEKILILDYNGPSMLPTSIAYTQAEARLQVIVIYRINCKFVSNLELPNSLWHMRPVLRFCHLVISVIQVAICCFSWIL